MPLYGGRPDPADRTPGSRLGALERGWMANCSRYAIAEQRLRRPLCRPRYDEAPVRQHDHLHHPLDHRRPLGGHRLPTGNQLTAVTLPNQMCSVAQSCIGDTEVLRMIAELSGKSLILI